MTNIKVVIGSNFGDEGKGLMTDYFCHKAISSKETCIAVMSNGGAQRGHTVVTPEGKRHVFKHFSSGTMAGATTYCAADFILNPMTFRQEYEELIQLGIHPKIYIHPQCSWSTPYDMIINQIAEEARETKKHGSCGMGIWETVYRYQKHPNLFSIIEFASLTKGAQTDLLKRIRDSYMPNRLKEHGISSVPDAWKEIVYSDQLIEHFLSDVQFMFNHVRSAGYALLRCYQNVVFENGQGLLLDQNQTLYGDNTTPSNTGVLNPAMISSAVFDKADIEICYVSRSYMTRHGAGRFNEECKKELINPNMFDETNQTNQFQDHLRYGELDEKDLITRINHDLLHMKRSSLNWRSSIAFTHINEKGIDYSKFQENFGDNIYASDRRDRDSVKRIL